MSILLTLSLISGLSTFAFAEGNAATETTQSSASSQKSDLTDAQSQERETYKKIHFNDMNQLVELRKQTKVAQDANNVIAKQIKDNLKAKTALNKDSVAKLKPLAIQKKGLKLQTKQLQQQRLSLKKQYRDCVKSKDVNKIKTISQQILAINKQINDLKAKNDALKVQISPLKSQLKSTRDARSELKNGVKDQLKKAKTILETIKTQQQEKTQLWKTYKENIKNKDYTTSGKTFKSIINKKSTILDNIKQRGIIMNQILPSLD